MYLEQSTDYQGHFPDQTGILEMLSFKRGKPEYKMKNLSEQGREPTTNTSHI